MENGAETADEGVIALIAGAGGLNRARARAVLLALRDAGVLAVPPDEHSVPLSREKSKAIRRAHGVALDGFEDVLGRADATHGTEAADGATLEAAEWLNDYTAQGGREAAAEGRGPAGGSAGSRRRQKLRQRAEAAGTVDALRADGVNHTSCRNHTPDGPRGRHRAADSDHAGCTLARATGLCACNSPADPDGARTIARFRTDEGATFYLVAGAWTDHLLPARVRRSYDDARGRPDFTPCGDGTPTRGLLDAVEVRVVFSVADGARYVARARLDAAVGAERLWDCPVWVLEAAGDVSEVDRAAAEYAMGEGADGGTIDGDSPVDWHVETVVVLRSERGSTRG